MALDIYSTRAQLKAIEAMPREYSFLFDLFCRDGGCVEDDKAIYDYRKGDRKMAPMVVPGAGGVLMERGGFETREIGFCQIAPERIITNNDLKGRSFGENVFGALSPQDREKKMLVKDQMEMLKAIQRRREWMVRQVLMNGKLEVFRYTNEGRDLETTLVADYGFTNRFTPATAWGQAGCKISDDMKAMFDMVFEGLGAAEVIVMDSHAANVVASNEDYMKKFNYRNAEFGKINTRYVGQGVRYMGTNEDGVDMFSFSGSFTDDDGLVKKILPRGTVLMGSRGMLNCYHGPVTQVEDTGSNAQHKTYFKKEVPLRYASIESNAIKNRITSCPAIVPGNVDGWVVANVLG